MQKIFIADEGFEREIKRSRARGHKVIKIDDDVEVGCAISMVTEGDVLRIHKIEHKDNEQEVFVFLCKEFGLTDYDDTIAKMSTIFCDNGWMLATLWDGAIIMNLENKLLMPVVGEHKSPKVVQEDIYWVNEEDLLGYEKYLEEPRGKFIYDYELFMTVTGQIIGSLRHLNIKFLPDEDIDLSLGVVANYLQSQQTKKDAKKASNLMTSILNQKKTEDSYEDEDDEDIDLELDEDEDDDFEDFEDYEEF